MKHLTITLLTLLVLGGCGDSSEKAKENWEEARKYFQSGDHESSLAHLRLAAEGGYPIAQYTLGLFSLDKSHPMYDPEKGLVLIEKSYQQGFVQAATRLGTIYQKGDLVEKDFNKSKKYINEAANKKDPEALYWLGINSFDGINGFQLNRKEGVLYLKESLKLGYRKIEEMVSFMTFYFFEDFQPSNEELERAESFLLNDPIFNPMYTEIQRKVKLQNAYTLLAVTYHPNTRNLSDLDKSCDYFKKLHEAKNKYGSWMYVTCQDVNLDSKVQITKNLASEGVSTAHHTLGYLYEFGLWGLSKNKKKARYHYKQAMDDIKTSDNQQFYLQFYDTDPLVSNKEEVNKAIERLDGSIRKKRYTKKTQSKDITPIAADAGKEVASFLFEALKFTAEIALVAAVVAVDVAASSEGQAYFEEKNQREREAYIYEKGRRDGERYRSRQKRNMCNIYPNNPGC